MTERINGQGFRPTDAAGTRRTDATKRGGGSSSADSSAASAPSTSDQVNLTRSGVLLSKLEEIVQSAPAVDVDRVRAIRTRSRPAARSTTNASPTTCCASTASCSPEP
jgi:hypothetical protein